MLVESPDRPRACRAGRASEEAAALAQGHAAYVAEGSCVFYPRKEGRKERGGGGGRAKTIWGIPEYVQPPNLLSPRWYCTNNY